MGTLIVEHLWWVTCLISVIWAVRLKLAGLVRSYPTLFSYLGFTVVFSLLIYSLLQFAPRGRGASLYGWLWVVGQPLSWTLYFCLVIEVYNRMLKDFKGMQRLGQLVMYAASAGVGMLFLLMIFLDASAETWKQFWTLQERSIYIALTTLCLLLLSLAVFFHLPVPRNTRVVFATFGMIFALQAGLLAIERLLGDEFRQTRYMIISIVSALCLLAGMVLFSRDGEQVVHVLPRPKLDEGTENMLKNSLQSFNDVLMKVLRS